MAGERFIPSLQRHVRFATTPKKKSCNEGATTYSASWCLALVFSLL